MECGRVVSPHADQRGRGASSLHTFDSNSTALRGRLAGWLQVVDYSYTVNTVLG